MHDAKKQPLKLGDIVIVPFRIESISATADYCNCSLRSVGTRLPDHTHECVGSLNTNVSIRANPGDDASFECVWTGDKTRLRFKV